MCAKVLIYPDIHHRTARAEKFLATHGDKFDQRVFLGDYFDDFDDTTTISWNTAKFVKKLLDDPKNVLLLGNHDIPYMYPYNQTVSCPGFTIQKSLAIGEILKMEDWYKMKLVHIIDEWIISHAGVHLSFFGYPRFDAKDITHVIIEEACNQAMKRLEYNGWDSLLMPGLDRGFPGQQFGGITWLDWRSLNPINGFNQIVGHTPNRFPEVRFLNEEGFTKSAAFFGFRPTKPINSQCWCVDSELGNYIGVLENSVFTVYDADTYQ